MPRYHTLVSKHRPLDHCFRFAGAPGADSIAHAALIEVQMWRMLHEARQDMPDLTGADVLDRWVDAQRAALAQEEEPEEREYRLRLLELAAARVRGRLRREIAEEVR